MKKSKLRFKSEDNLEKYIIDLHSHITDHILTEKSKLEKIWKGITQIYMLMERNLTWRTVQIRRKSGKIYHRATLTEKSKLEKIWKDIS